MAHPEIEYLLKLLDEGYERAAWHGPNLRGSIRGVGASQAARRLKQLVYAPYRTNRESVARRRRAARPGAPQTSRGRFRVSSGAPGSRFKGKPADAAPHDRGDCASRRLSRRSDPVVEEILTRKLILLDASLDSGLSAWVVREPIWGPRFQKAGG